MTTYGPNRQGTQHYVGTVGRLLYVPRIGTVGHGGSVAVSAITYVNRIGTVGHAGTTVIGYVTRVGTLGHVGSQPYLGSVNRLGGGYLGTVNYVPRVGTIGGMYMGTKVLQSAVHTATGSFKLTSWFDIHTFKTKTLVTRIPTSGGSSYVIVGAQGTSIGMTGTYSVVRVGPGSLVTQSFTEALYYARFASRAGSSNTGKGTLYQYLNLFGGA